MKQLFIFFICYTFVFTSPSFFLQEPSPISTNPTLRSLSSTKNDVKCFYVDPTNYSVYSLVELKKDTPYKISVGGDSYVFNFCEDISSDVKSLFAKCQSSEVNKNNCQLVGQSMESEDSTGSISVSQTELNYTLGISDNTDITSVKFQITCPSEEEGDVHFEPKLSPLSTEKDIIITGKHKAGCEIVSFYAVTQFLEKYWYLTTIITIIIGIILCFFGSKFINVSMVIILGLAVPIILSIFVFDFLNVTSQAAVWGIYIGGIIVGVILGILIAKFEQFFGAIIGGVLGYLSNIFVYNLALRYIETSRADVMYYVILVLCIIICALLGYCFISKVKIIGTSIIGGYSIVRGISFVAGGFVSEQIIFDLLSNKELDQVSSLLSLKMFIYLGGWVFLSGIGCYIQFNVTSPENKKENDEERPKSKYQQIKDKQNRQY